MTGPEIGPGLVAPALGDKVPPIPSPGMAIRVGVVSDTHGLLRPEVLPALAGVSRILHLGDICEMEILDALATVAPVTAVRGNNDRRGSCRHLPETEVVTMQPADGPRVDLYMLHDLGDLDLEPAAAGFAAVLSGHTHQPKIERRKGVLFFNPGSCGPLRFKHPVTLGMLTIGPAGELDARVLRLL